MATQYIKDGNGKFKGSIGSGKTAAPKARAAAPRKADPLDDIPEPTLEDLIGTFEQTAPRTPVTQDDLQKIMNQPLDQYQEDEGNYRCYILEAPELYRAAIATDETDPDGRFLVRLECISSAYGPDTLAEEEFADEDEADEWASEQLTRRYREYAIFALRYDKDADVARMHRRAHIEKLGTRFVTVPKDASAHPELIKEIAFGDRTAEITKLGRRYHVSVYSNDYTLEVHHEVDFPDRQTAEDFAEEMVLITSR